MKGELISSAVCGIVVQARGDSESENQLRSLVCMYSLPPTSQWSWSVFHLVSSCGEGAMSCLTDIVLNGPFSRGGKVNDPLPAPPVVPW